MTPLETLKAARDLISDPARWTQGALARDANGNEIDSTDNGAICWCSFGAIQVYTQKKWLTDVDHYLQKVCCELFDTSAERYNDTHTHAEVLALFDAAIAELEGANVA